MPHHRNEQRDNQNNDNLEAESPRNQDAPESGIDHTLLNTIITRTVTAILPTIVSAISQVYNQGAQVGLPVTTKKRKRKNRAVGSSKRQVRNQVSSTRKSYGGKQPKCEICEYHHPTKLPCRKCAICEKYGHVTAVCRNTTRRQDNSQRTTKKILQVRKDKACYNCGNSNHMRPHCPLLNKTTHNASAPSLNTDAQGTTELKISNPVDQTLE
jgi:hypothetical protein